MKRISMAGSDIAVTDERIATTLLEYAKHLGRAGTTDTVTLPVAANGQVQEASLLLGPASEISVTENNDISLEHIELPGVEEFVEDLQGRLHRLRGHDDGSAPSPADTPGPTPDPVPEGSHDLGDAASAFVDFGNDDGRKG